MNAICPVCKSQQLIHLHKEKIWDTFLCKVCDLIFFWPMKNPGKDWYQNSEIYYEIELRTSTFLNYGQKCFLNKPIGKNLCDLGCGNGEFLEVAEKKGFNVVGVDFNKNLIKKAKERLKTQELYEMSFEDFFKYYQVKKFDVITFFEVLEHIDDLDSFLNGIKNLLRSKGYIALTVPNRERFFNYYSSGWDLPPHHFTQWNKKCLRYFLEKNGFEILELKTSIATYKDLAGYLGTKISFGIAKSMIRNVREKDKIKKTSILPYRVLKLKNLLWSSFCFPTAPFLYFLKLQGPELYCLAKLKQ